MKKRASKSDLICCTVVSMFFVYLIVISLVIIPSVRAYELDEFQRAREAYEVQDYALAASLFEILVGKEVPQLRSKALLLESYKFLGASYLFLGKYAKAEQTFEKLLRNEPSYRLDPLAFPAEVQKTFNLVQQRLAWERIQAEQAKRRAEKEAKKKQAEAVAIKREKLLRLADLAEYESVERVNSRWIAMIPFGIGQYQNNHPNAGTFFAVTEGLLLALNITSYLVHQDLKGQTPTGEEIGEARFAEKSFRVTNWISLGVFVGMVVTGIIDAQIRFKHRESWERRRQLPDELRDVLKNEFAGDGTVIRF